MQRPIECATCDAGHDQGCQSCRTQPHRRCQPKLLPISFGDRCELEIFDRAGCIQPINDVIHSSLRLHLPFSLGTKSEEQACNLQRLVQQNHAGWHDTSCSVQKKVISPNFISSVGSSDRKQRNGKHVLYPRCWPRRGTGTQAGFVHTHGFCSRGQAVAAGTSE